MPSYTRFSYLVLTLRTKVLHIITFLDAKWNATDRVATEKTKYDTGAPLIPSTLILKLGSLFLHATGALNIKRSPFPKYSRYSDKFPLLFGNHCFRILEIHVLIRSILINYGKVLGLS